MPMTIGNTFAAQLKFQLITNEDAMDTVALMTRAACGEGFLTVESARQITAATLAAVAQQIPEGLWRDEVLAAVRDIDPERSGRPSPGVQR